MSKIRIKNFGPIKEGYKEKDGWIEIDKITIFIGNQGTGKSTIAKLISTFTWIEKALTRGDYQKSYFERKDKFRDYLKYHKIDKYFHYHDTTSNADAINEHDFSIIEYIGDSYTIKYKSRHLTIEENRLANYPLPQIMYMPSDRNFLSSVGDLKFQRLFSDTLVEVLSEMQNAKGEIDGKIKFPINNVDLEYDQDNDVLYIKGKDYKINLAEASSGYQSTVPLFLVTWYLANTVKEQSEIRQPMTSDELQRFKNGVSQIWADSTLSEQQQRVAISVLSAKFNKTAFVNIVEEPEQNLFPESQWSILGSLIGFNNVNKGNKLIMTTHSPYIINYFTLLVKAFVILEKVANTKIETDIKDRVKEIVPFDSIVNPNDLSVYEIDDDGCIIKLGNYKGLPSDDNYLNAGLEKSNDLFSKLLDIEDLCQ